jgi:transcriptional regulator with GAF, ATPase, and Fis domain
MIGPFPVDVGELAVRDVCRLTIGLDSGGSMTNLPVLLVCTDRVMQSHHVARLLRERGYEAIFASSRAEAIAALALGDPDLARTALFREGVADERDSEDAARQPGPVFLKEIARQAAQRAEREEILKMLQRTRWNRVRTAKLLNISYRALLYKMKEAGLERTPAPVGFSE